MNQNICYNCGGEIISRGGRLICSSCGSYMPEQISGEEVSLLYAAFQKLRLADFYEAEREFDDIIRRHPRNAQAYWGRLMSHYGIKYEKDYDGRNIPTCYATSIDSVYESSDYRKALELADAETQAVFKDHADYMERVRKEWLEKASREKPYDIFISFKDSDDEEQKKGRKHTQDSDDLRELYLYLMKKGYRVFFSRESLEGKGGEKYEPYIYAALSTANVMLVYGSKPEYINATWVKNEWTRYQKRIRSGEKHPDSLIVAYNGFSPKDLPFELSESGRQHLDASKPSFYNELIEIIERIMGEIAVKSKKTPSAEPKKKKPVISALHEHSYKEIVVKPTCISMGYTLHQCECGEEYKDSFTPLGDHSYQVTSRIDPTCTENGTEEETCEFCGQKQTRELSAIGHAFTEWTEAKHPTCTEDGEEQRKCQNCGEVETQTLQKTGHSFGDWMKNPDGTSVRYCKHCGMTKTQAAKAAKEAKTAKTERVQETIQEETITETKKKKKVFPVLLSLFSLIIVGCIAGFMYFGSPANHNNDENPLYPPTNQTTVATTTAKKTTAATTTVKKTTAATTTAKKTTVATTTAKKTTAATTTLATTTVPPVFARFDFGTYSKGEALGMTSHEYLVEALTYDNYFIDVVYTQDSIIVTACQSHPEILLGADGKEAPGGRYGVTSYALCYEDLVTYNFDDELKKEHKYLRFRIKNNTTNNIMSFRWHVNSQLYSTHHIATCMYLQGGAPTVKDCQRGNHKLTCDPSTEYAVYTYDINFLAAMGRFSARGEAPGASYGAMLEYVANGGSISSNSWNSMGSKSVEALEFFVLGAYGGSATSAGFAYGDTRANIVAGATVEIDYILFGVSVEDLNKYTSYLEDKSK